MLNHLIHIQILLDANILQNLDNAKYLNEINIIIGQITELSHIRKLKELRELRRMSCCLKNYTKKTVVLTPQRP